MRIPLSSPDITEAEIAAVTSVLRTNSLSLGPKLTEFEEALATRHLAPYAVAVSSGTAALHLAIRALNIGEGEEVIVPSFTFIAVANALLYERAIPVFVDINPITLNLDPECVEAAITPRTRAIIVVHTFGVPADMASLIAIARRHNLFIIEDACEAIGATYNSRPVGSLGDISTFAFYPNKQITTGEGGAVVTNEPELANRIRAMRNQGRPSASSSDWLQHSELGYNYRLSELACALGIVQLSRLESILEMREKVARQYDALLANIDAITRPPIHIAGCTISWFVYVVRLGKQFPPGTRDRILNSLQEKGIGCGRYFAPIHLQPAYRAVKSAQHLHLPVTDSVAERTLALPFFNRLSLEQIEETVSALAAALSREIR